MSSSQHEDANNTQCEQRPRRTRRALGSMMTLTACLALIAFYGVADNPRFETIHTVDVIRLMAAGAGVAVTVMLLIQFLSFPGPSSEPEKEKEQGRS